MIQDKASVSVAHIEQAILLIRGQKVMLDTELARVYGVATKVLNQAVKRNPSRFPADFVFQLTAEEMERVNDYIGASHLRSQFVTSNVPSGLANRSRFVTSSPATRGGRRYLPYAFTEHGAIMAATVLNSPRAVQMSVFVVRAFVKMRAVLSGNRALARKLAALEQELKQRLGIHETSIVDILRRLMDIIDPPPLPVPPKPPIGFQVKERAAVYGAVRAAARD